MHYSKACPVCLDTNPTRFLSCKDHVVSHETFHLERCTKCQFVYTNPRPDDKAITRYYQSDTYISHSNKSHGLLDLVYRISRRFTVKWKYDLIHKNSLRTPSTVLDYGCGTGAFLQECQKNKMKISGVEPSIKARKQANKNTNSNISENLSEISDHFDVITLWHVLEHVPDFQLTLNQLKNHLAEKGTMFIAVPNLQSLDAQKYKEYWAAFDTPRHLWHFSVSTMKMALARHNLMLIDVKPMKLDSYYVSLLSEKYKNGKNNVLNISRALLNGWTSNQVARKTNEYSSLIYIIRK